MVRRGTEKRFVAWYIREWMAAANMKGRGAQAKMMSLTGWSKATMSQIWNDEQDFSPKILREAADALSIAPYELLLTPEEAHALRGLRAQAGRVVEIARSAPEIREKTEQTGTGG